MSLNFVANPYSYYNNREKTGPLYNGKIYVGKPNLDPTIEDNWKEVTAKQKDGTQVPISQPVSTNSGGYAVDSAGNPVVLLVDGNYSIRVYDKNGQLALEQSNVESGAPLTANDLYSNGGTILEAKNGLLSVNSISDLRLLEPTVDGQQIELLGHTVAGIGGGTFYYDSSDTTSEDNNGTFLVTPENKRWIRSLSGFVNPEMFGHIKGQIADDSLEAANLAASNTGSIHLSGDYLTSKSFSFEEKTGGKIQCNGRVRILSNNKSESVMKISGRLVSLAGDLEVGYIDSVSLDISDTDAVGILFTGLARSSIDIIRMNHVGIGFKIDNNTGFGFPNGQNAVFSVSFAYIDIFDFSYAAFDFRPFNGGNTGNSISNWYMSNNVEGTPQVCDRFGWIGTTSETSIGQWNFERAECRHLVTMQSDADAISADSIHIEGVIPNNQNDGFFFLNNNTIFNASTITLVGNEFDDSKAATYSLFRLGEEAKANIGGVVERDSVVTGSPNVRMVRYAGGSISNSQLEVKDVKIDTLQALEFGVPQGMRPALRIREVYPSAGILVSTDASVNWNPASSQRVVSFKDLTTGRSFIVTTAREYDGLQVDVINLDDASNVGITAGTFTDTLAAGEKKTLYFDGTDYTFI